MSEPTFSLNFNFQVENLTENEDLNKININETGSHFVFLLLGGEKYLANHLRASQSACAKSTIYLCGIY